jgi:hypothetical protein
MPGLRHSTPQGVTIRPLRETFTIGRDAQNDLALLDDPLVSHQRACIRHVGDMYVIEDLHSTNGTFPDREFKVTRITPPQPLLPHDIIRVGSSRFVFEMDLATDTPPPTPPAAEPDVPPLAPEEPDVATQVLRGTRVGRYLPVFLEPPEASAPAPHLAAPILPGPHGTERNSPKAPALRPQHVRNLVPERPFIGERERSRAWPVHVVEGTSLSTHEPIPGILRHVHRLTRSFVHEGQHDGRRNSRRYPPCRAVSQIDRQRFRRLPIRTEWTDHACVVHARQVLSCPG